MRMGGNFWACLAWFSVSMETSASLIGGLVFENMHCLLYAASMRSVCDITTNQKLLIEHSNINIYMGAVVALMDKASDL